MPGRRRKRMFIVVDVGKADEAKNQAQKSS